MTTFNKILLENIENNTILKEDLLEILKLLNTISSNQKHINNIKKEKQNLEKDVFFIKNCYNNSPKYQNIYTSNINEINNEIDKILLIDSINILKSNYLLKQQIYKIMAKYNKNNLIKSSTTKYKKKLESLNIKKEKILNEIKNTEFDIKFLKVNTKTKNDMENYINTLKRKNLFQIEKEIAKQNFYISIFDKNKGR